MSLSKHARAALLAVIPVAVAACSPPTGPTPLPSTAAAQKAPGVRVNLLSGYVLA